MSDQLVELFRSIRADLDAFDRRLEALERAPLMTFRMNETIAARRRVVRRMRQDGLSVERIARSLDAPRSTIIRDLEAIGAPTPTAVLGANGRTWHRQRP